MIKQAFINIAKFLLLVVWQQIVILGALDPNSVTVPKKYVNAIYMKSNQDINKTTNVQGF